MEVWNQFPGWFFFFPFPAAFLFFLTDVTTIMPTTITTCTITTSTLTSPSSPPTTTYWNSKGCFGISFCWTIATWFERLINVVLKWWGRRTLKWKKKTKEYVYDFFSVLCVCHKIVSKQAWKLNQEWYFLIYFIMLA